MDAIEAQGRAHETRLLFFEAHVKVLLRGFTAMQEFLRDLPGDFRLAKSAFYCCSGGRVEGENLPLKRHVASMRQRHCFVGTKGAIWEPRQLG